MATRVHPGYMGYAQIGGFSNAVRFTDANIAAKQDINIPDLVMGHWNRNAYTYNAIDVSGSISGPVTETFADGDDSLWGWGWNRGDCGELEGNDVTLFYFCGENGGKSRNFGDLYVNSLSFSCSAGDLAQFSLDVTGKAASDWGGYGGPQTHEEKLVTWDHVGVTVTNEQHQTFGEDAFSSFEFTINNNLEVVYAIHETANYFPFDIVPGLRTITGSLSVYNIPGSEGANAYTAFQADGYGRITFNVGGGEQSANVRFHRVEPTLSASPIISTVGFTGVGNQGE